MTDDEYAKYHQAIDFHYKFVKFNHYTATKKAIGEIIQELFNKSEN